MRTSRRGGLSQTHCISPRLLPLSWSIGKGCANDGGGAWCQAPWFSPSVALAPPSTSLLPVPFPSAATRSGFPRAARREAGRLSSCRPHGLLLAPLVVVVWLAWPSLPSVRALSRSGVASLSIIGQACPCRPCPQSGEGGSERPRRWVAALGWGAERVYLRLYPNRSECTPYPTLKNSAFQFNEK